MTDTASPIPLDSAKVNTEATKLEGLAKNYFGADREDALTAAGKFYQELLHNSDMHTPAFAGAVLKRMHNDSAGDGLSFTTGHHSTGTHYATLGTSGLFSGNRSLFFSVAPDSTPVVQANIAEPTNENPADRNFVSIPPTSSRADVTATPLTPSQVTAEATAIEKSANHFISGSDRQKGFTAFANEIKKLEKNHPDDFTQVFDQVKQDQKKGLIVPGRFFPEVRVSKDKKGIYFDIKPDYLSNTGLTVRISPAAANYAKATETRITGIGGGERWLDDTTALLHTNPPLFGLSSGNTLMPTSRDSD